jgi:hypothetical protein
MQGLDEALRALPPMHVPSLGRKSPSDARGIMLRIEKYIYRLYTRSPCLVFL